MKPYSFKKIENLGRERLSRNFFLREFLHSEISQHKGIPNLPHFPDIAIKNGRRLCHDILEPIQAYLGKIHIRSGYRSPEINEIGARNNNQYGCSSNPRSYSGHVWDYADNHGKYGATACVVVCSYVDYFESTGDWQSMANWIHLHIEHYSSICFYPKLCAFNISWHERPIKKIRSYSVPRGIYTPSSLVSASAPLPSL